MIDAKTWNWVIHSRTDQLHFWPVGQTICPIKRTVLWEHCDDIISPWWWITQFSSLKKNLHKFVLISWILASISLGDGCPSWGSLNLETTLSSLRGLDLPPALILKDAPVPDKNLLPDFPVCDADGIWGSLNLASPPWGTQSSDLDLDLPPAILSPQGPTLGPRFSPISCLYLFQLFSFLKGKDWKTPITELVHTTLSASTVLWKFTIRLHRLKSSVKNLLKTVLFLQNKISLWGER